MKFTVSTAISALAIAMVTFTQVTEAQSTCAAQTVFDQCKRNEDGYIATCNTNPIDYACLCKWQTAKVSCWDTCPDDIQRGTEDALRITYCSQPGANITVVPTSSALPSTTQSSVGQPSSTPSQSPGAGSDATSLLAEGNNIFYIAGALVAGYMLQ